MTASPGSRALPGPPRGRPPACRPWRPSQPLVQPPAAAAPTGAAPAATDASVRAAPVPRVRHRERVHPHVLPVLRHPAGGGTEGRGGLARADRRGGVRPPGSRDHSAGQGRPRPADDRRLVPWDRRLDHRRRGGRDHRGRRDRRRQRPAQGPGTRVWSHGCAEHGDQCRAGRRLRIGRVGRARGHGRPRHRRHRDPGTLLEERRRAARADGGHRVIGGRRPGEVPARHGHRRERQDRLAGRRHEREGRVDRGHLRPRPRGRRGAQQRLRRLDGPLQGQPSASRRCRSRSTGAPRPWSRSRTPPRTS